MPDDALTISWESDVAHHDYDAALAYLTLLLDKSRAGDVVHRLKEAKVTERRANDILRACHRDPLPMHDPGVVRDHAKVAQGHKLSPVLVVSFEFGGDIADGYHRVSLTYNMNPFAMVPLRMVSLVSR
jgi:hypothetical protein